MKGPDPHMEGSGDFKPLPFEEPRDVNGASGEKTKQ